MRHKLVQRIVAAYDRVLAEDELTLEVESPPELRAAVEAALAAAGVRRRARGRRPGGRGGDPAAQPRAPRARRPDRRALVPRRRGGPVRRPARARRRGDLPRAHRGPGRGGGPRRAPPVRPRPRGRLGRDAGPPGPGDGGAAKTRRGFVALAGRPNVGKSTLLNTLVGEKVAIVSNRPQTTRRAIRGIATRDDAQLVLVDLPGVQRPRDPLTERMQRRMEHELRESDAALLVLNGQQGVGPGRPLHRARRSRPRACRT